MNRLLAEILGSVALVGALTGWWVEHNHQERAIGAQGCINSTSTTRAVATADTQAIEQAHADQLSKVVTVYEQKAAVDRANSADLAQRLHDADAALHRGAVSPVGTPAGFVCSRADDPAPTEREKQIADTLAVCVANADELDAIRQAWIDQAAAVSKHP